MRIESRKLNKNYLFKWNHFYGCSNYKRLSTRKRSNIYTLWFHQSRVNNWSNEEQEKESKVKIVEHTKYKAFCRAFLFKRNHWKAEFLKESFDQKNISSKKGHNLVFVRKSFFILKKRKGSPWMSVPGIYFAILQRIDDYSLIAQWIIVAGWKVGFVWGSAATPIRSSTKSTSYDHTS